MAFFDYLEIRIQPQIFDGMENEIRIKVKMVGQPNLEIREKIPDDYFESYFDYVFDRAKKFIKDEIDKKKKEIFRPSLVEVEKYIEKNLKKSNG